MNTWVSKGILAAAIALPALSAAAWAGGGEDFVCSNATLKGKYAFGVTNYTVPEVVAGIKVFYGDGTLTQRDYAGDNLAGDDFSPPGQETGTYKVNSDCTGSMTINLNAPNTPPPPWSHTDQIRNQRRRPSYPRSCGRIHPAWTYLIRADANQR